MCPLPDHSSLHPDHSSDNRVVDELSPRQSFKGRGATVNPANRYLATESVRIDDGWLTDQVPEPAPETEFYPDRTVQLITRNSSPDIPFDRSINAYKGCEHGCVYCFARPTHAYLDLSPGLDFETRIFYKTNVRERLLAELDKPRYSCQPIAMGTNTDPYQPAEKQLGLTRQILEVALQTRHPVTLVTKSQLILKDLDLLGELAALELVAVGVSVTTLDNSLKVKLEPRTASPAARLRTIESLRKAGIPTGAMVAPVIPFINDSEMEDIVAACAEAGASHAGYILLRLPLEVAPLFEDWLNTHYPMKTQRVMNTIRHTRAGKVYNAQWGKRMRGEGVFAELLARRFEAALNRHGLGNEPDVELRTDLFRAPAGGQISLF